MSASQTPTLADLSPKDLASIQNSDGYLGTDTQQRLAAITRAAPECAANLAELEALARDADSGDNLELAYDMNERFDLLLEAGADASPHEVLGVKDLEDVRYHDLITIAKARAERAEDPSRFLELKRTLMRAEASQYEQQIEGIVQWLVLLSSEGAGRVLQQAGELYAEETGRPIIVDPTVAAWLDQGAADAE